MNSDSVRRKAQNDKLEGEMLMQNITGAVFSQTNELQSDVMILWCFLLSTRLNNFHVGAKNLLSIKINKKNHKLFRSFFRFFSRSAELEQIIAKN